jgi:hypothetical protein
MALNSLYLYALECMVIANPAEDRAPGIATIHSESVTIDAV